MSGLSTDDLVNRVQQRIAAQRVPPTSAVVAQAVRAEAGVLVSDAEMLRLIRLLQRELVGTGPLAPLLADPDTTDVVVNRPDDVRVDRGHGWQQTEIRFPDDGAVQRLARRLAATVDQRLDDAHPYVDAQLPEGIRLHAVLGSVAASGTCLSLRVLRPTRYGLAELGRVGALPGQIGPTLRAVLDARLAFLVSGGTGSGKTTLLAAMLGAVPADERIVTVEDAGELEPDHPHLVRLVARADNVEGVGRIDLRELVRQALRMRPDRLVVGEVRGAEVVDLLAALNTGHDGGAGTLHANAVAEVPARLEALGSLGGLNRAALHAQLAGAVQVVVHMRRHRPASPEGDGATDPIDRSERPRPSRSVAEVGVLVADGHGLVVPRTALDGNGRPGPGAATLQQMLADRGVPAPW